ncbi:hypothetical protein [Coleofasciculus sp.]|jgi:hypothetical protein|uniref:hypothetical protein n=1 Tax=Coleofasciculus sp. TaxID=3100458 RepID=UPI003A2B9AAE
MRVNILIFGIFVIYVGITFQVCKAQPPLKQVDSQKKVVLSSYKSEHPMTKPSVEIKFIERRFRRPPIVDLLMDVTLRNHHAQPCWFLLPATLDSSSPLGQGSVNSVEVFELGGQGRVVVGRFLGTANFQAFLLPAGAELKLRGLPISLWEEEIVNGVEIEAVVASQLTVDSEPAQTWFGINPISDLKAEVSEDQIRRLASRSTPNLEEVPVSVVEKERIQLQVILGKDDRH